MTKLRGLRSTSRLLQYSRGDVMYSTGNRVRNILTTTCGARWVLEISGRGHFIKCVVVQPLGCIPEPIQNNIESKLQLKNKLKNKLIKIKLDKQLRPQSRYPHSAQSWLVQTAVHGHRAPHQTGLRSRGTVTDVATQLRTPIFSLKSRQNERFEILAC